MIYFDKSKSAYAYEIRNPICTISDELWAQYAATDKWDIINGQFIDISDTEEYKQKKQAEHEKEFDEQFFKTSLGYVRRTVTMKNGTKRDFLADILPRLKAGVQIITYNKDLTQNFVLVTEEFINECDNQFLKDFYGG